MCQKCTSKGIWRQDIVLKRTNSLQKSLCPVVIRPYLCSSECEARALWNRFGMSMYLVVLGNSVYVSVDVSFTLPTHDLLRFRPAGVCTTETQKNSPWRLGEPLSVCIYNAVGGKYSAWGTFRLRFVSPSRCCLWSSTTTGMITLHLADGLSRRTPHWLGK